MLLAYSPKACSSYGSRAERAWSMTDLALVSLALRILPPLPISRRRIWNAKIRAHCEMQWRLHITPTKATAEGFHTEDIR